MRIAFVNHNRRKVGGAEVYLDSVMPAFAAAGHEITWIYETDSPSDREPISCPPGSKAWYASRGVTPLLPELKLWSPRVIFIHGLLDPDLEAALIRVAPSIHYVHNYYGTCISGNKLNATAEPHVCERRFGPACLAHYFPQRCGGSNPLTMLSQYRLQSRRLDLMRRYTALVTNSQHMVRELERHGLRAECVYPFVAAETIARGAPPKFTDNPLRLVFAGRMSSLKGGDYLLAALPKLREMVGRKLHLTFAGDGPARAQWEQTAANIQTDGLTFDFPGWLSAAEVRRVIGDAHLLVFPSVWPEPFGLSGLEAGLHGVPAVAFAVGGIPEWLNDGVNGHLAPAQPSAENLAGAMAKAFSSEEHYEQLRAGACRVAHRYPLADHIAQLTRIFERCAA
jgi:glycosyltransferase involved in cell wall biosynthesis